MVIILFLLFLSLFFKYKNIKGNTKVLLFFYLISVSVSLINYIFQIRLDEPINDFAVLYYLICLILLLYPFFKNGCFTYENYYFPPRLMKIISWVLIISGLINMVYSITELSSLVTNIEDFLSLRESYYHDIHSSSYHYVPKNSLHVLTNVISYVSYLCPICSLYYILKGNTKLFILLLIASLVTPIRLMLIGEREACLVVISNYIFAYYFFSDSFDDKIKRKIKLTFSVPLIFLGGFIVLMTFMRFNDRLGASLIAYIGEQPFNFSYFFNHLESQSLGGKLNFGYFFPEEEQLTEQINHCISSSKYLNVFGGIVGSLFLDFGYFTIVVCLIFSLFFSTLFKLFANKRNNKLPFVHFFLLLLLYQILFVGIFYNEYTTKYNVGTSFLLVVIFVLYDYYFVNHEQIRPISKNL